MPEIENLNFTLRYLQRIQRSLKNRTTGTIMTMVIEGCLYSIFSKRHIER